MAAVLMVWYMILPLDMASVLMVWYIYCFTIRYGSCTDGVEYEFTITYGSVLMVWYMILPLEMAAVLMVWYI